MSNITIEKLARATGSTSQAAAKFHPWLVSALGRFNIDTPARQAAFLATVAIESAKLSATEEGLYYRDARRLASIYPRAFKSPEEAGPYVANPKGLGRILYGGYWGRGLIQLTWEKNYRAATLALGTDYVRQPELVATPEHAALTAAWYWATNGCNEAADRRDMVAVTKLVNGPAMLHLQERKDQFKIALAVLA